MVIAVSSWISSKKRGRGMKRSEWEPYRLLLLKKLRVLEYQHGLGEIPGLESGKSDTVDQANGELDKDLFFHLHERGSRAIREIYRALGRIAEGTFGICEDCGEGISHRRLRANPSAALCLECQKTKEREERIHISDERRPRIFLEA